MKTIAIEEHFSTDQHMNFSRAILEKKYPVTEVIEEEKAIASEIVWLSTPFSDKLLDVGEGRLREIDEAGIEMQVLSLVQPGVQALDAETGTTLAKEINDGLSEAVKMHPKKLAGFATIAPQDPKAAADELERAIKGLGLKGASINSHTKGEYLDDKKYWAILERAEKLDVPIYLHPRAPSPSMINPYLGYPQLATAMCGFGHEVALHALRLIVSGAFDQFPKLKLILGHMGEALPYWLWRLDNMWGRGSSASKLKNLPSGYFKDNIFITTSGMFWNPPLLCACMAIGAERILFAVDYPFEQSDKAVDFIKSAPISDSDKEKICHFNAEQLLKL